MPKYFISVLLFRLVLPSALLISLALRPFGISILYLLLYLWLPLVPMPDYKTYSGWRGKVVLVNLMVSLALLLLHVAWHVYLFAHPPYGSVLPQCEQLQKMAQNLGLVRYDAVDPLMGAQLLAPELLMTATSLTVYLVMRSLLSNQPPEGEVPTDSGKQQQPFLTNAGKYMSLFLIMFSGTLRPSVTSGVYYLVFIGAATAWAAGRELARGYAVVCRCVMAIMAAHVAALFAYQCTYFAQLLPKEDLLARIFGFTQLVKIDCKKPNEFEYSEAEWTTFVSPIIILVTYYILALESRELFKPKAKKKTSAIGKLESGNLNGSLVRGVSFRHIGSPRPSTHDRWRSATKKVRLIRGISPTKRLLNKRSKPNIQGLHQDSTGSVIVPDEESMEDPGQPSWIDDVVLEIIGFFQVLIRSSYIATSITMMAWSIMYHSWLTFVLLMWANLMWLRQNQRSFMLNSSPLLVCYAIFLLLSQYIYSLDLSEVELPSKTEKVNLGQIGFTRPTSEACMPLIVKTLLACMFWVTLRQRNQEAAQRKQSSTIADMVAPLQLTVSTAATVMEKPQDEYGESRLMKKIGELLKCFCTRYWIYVVTIMLFIIGITGERMTIFRIIYMFLFLTFILLFQISWKLWRKLMYSFWIVLIMYSMVNLVLVYIYQFDYFPVTIETYLSIPVKLQYDLGLEKYYKADLFVRLLTPTCFLIITIMQVHYFHQDFLENSLLKSRTNSMAQNESARPSYSGMTNVKDYATAVSSEEEQPAGTERDAASDPEHSIEMSSLNRRSAMRSTKRSRSKSYATDRTTVGFRECVKMFAVKLSRVYVGCRDLLFLYLEIHLIKIIFLSLMLLCVLNVCALHVPIMLVISLALLLNSERQKLCALLISVLISVYLMAKMIYQIEYIPHNFFDVNCNTDAASDGSQKENVTTLNNAEWVGFVKANENENLPYLLKGYITMIAIFTFHSMVMYRQQRFRSFGLSGPNKDKIMFPDVTRREADKDLSNCMKYLFNYGFYKFGVEVTLICLMGVIGSRMDLYAVLYAFWLLALVSMSRARQACVWPAFTGYVTVLLPLQYMFAVGVLPQFCVHYPWSGSGEQAQSMRHWMFLSYVEDPPHATKIIFDYFLLLFCTLQLHVFRLEREYGEEYIGGSNSENVGRDWETLSFVNPVPDFLIHIGSYLDIVKRIVFLGMLWLTLAIMFLTGTNRVNLFSMGYLIGSFIFLWQGTDFYLRPKEAILKWWSWLLNYNVCVVVIKTLLQIPGCMFNIQLQNNACWLVQLLGIGCVDKFAGGSLHSFLHMDAANYKNAELTCSVPQEDIGLAWDGVCFAFLLLQRRFFHSYYFYRVIDESKATTVLASRGAELIEELRQKQMRQQQAAERKILEKIKLKMERIKANQKKIQGPSYADARQHDAEDEEETVGPESERAPLVHGDSETSARGYHTPESAGSPRGFHTPISDESSPPSPTTTPPPSSPERTAVPAIGYVPPPVGVAPPGQIPPGPPSPSSALMTVSLDAYLEPQRLSYSSPPASELMPRAHSPEESYPVFSPPLARRRHTVASPQAQRTSLISYSSRSANYSHHTSIRSGDYYMFDEFDDVDDDVTSLKNDDSTDEDVPREMGIGKLLSTAIKTDCRRAVSLQRASSLRRASAPAVRAARRLPSVASNFTYPRQAPRRQEEKPSDGVTHPTMVDITVPDGTGTERDLSELGLEPPEEEAFIDKIKHYNRLARAFVESLVVSITRHLLKYSRDYRYVSKALFNEKKILKEKKGFGIGIREGSQMIWQPLPEAVVQRSPYRTHRNVYQFIVRPAAIGRKLSNLSVPEIRILAPSMERGLDLRTPDSRRRRVATLDTDSDSDSESHCRRPDSVYSLPSTESKQASTLDEQEDSMFQKDRPPIFHFGCALWYAIAAHTDIVCYLMVFINQIQSATILSIPLPLMVFMWGTLTIPRPTKTFWVTLIAYTEVIVLVKSMFQFEMLPWNQKEIPDNMPFTAPRVIGIERKSNYALYDLLLLLIIFFHRFMLKSLGLWKESPTDVELREDAWYTLSPEETRMVAEGDIEEVGKSYADKHSKTGGNKNQTKSLEDAAGGEEEKEGKQLSEGEIQEESTHANLNKDNLDLPGTSKELYDDHYNVNDDQEPIIGVSTVLEDRRKHLPKVMRLAVQRYLLPVHQFFVRMLDPTARVTADVYAYMFMCDFLNFLVVIFGFAAFGTHQGDGGVQAYLEENKVPIPFLVMLILQFALIIIDRALYLRKFIFGKILFQYGLIIGVHIWMFFVLPFITERTFSTLIPPPTWYLVKCVYLLLSAYQIRCGYPHRIIGNFLCKGYNYVNMFLFRGFMAVPFVFELRTLMDWVWTDTSMTLMDWLKMEDISANVFLLKCSRYVEDEFPQVRGAKKRPWSKYLMGGTALAFIIAIIWFPLVLFAFGNSVGKSNPPTEATVKIRIGPFLPAYMMTAQSHNIYLFSEANYERLSNLYKKDRNAQTFLSNYMYDDVAAVSLNSDSTNVWAISPPELQRLELEAASNESLVIKMTYVLTHPTNSKDNPPTIEEDREVNMQPRVDGARNPQRDILYKMLMGQSTDKDWLLVKGLFPKFVKVFNKGTAKPAYQLIRPTPDNAGTEYRNVLMQLDYSKVTGVRYWRVKEDCSDDAEYNHKLKSIPMNDCENLVIYTFNDKLFPETLNFISGSGIIGLYTTFVFLASRLLRGFFSGIYSKIMFDDLPNVDRVLQMCLDIYLVREATELALEEDLFAKLVFLYRSPETMIKWTRPRERPEERAEIEEAPRPPPLN